MIAKNDGSFSVVKFAAADDEVDYTLIKKYGRTLGQIKIEKNTPVFEAMINQQHALKYPLISISNPDLVRLPNLSLTGEGVSSNVVSMGNVILKRRNLLITQNIVNETSIDAELRDQSYIVTMSNLFLEVVGSQYDNIDNNKRASYILAKSAGETAVGGSKLNLTLLVKPISEEQFSIYGARNNKSVIKTFVKVTGVNSGAVLEFQVSITKNT
jgi:hypothetical protein